jgi:hypothetical protein
VSGWQLSAVCEVQAVSQSLRVVHRHSDGARLAFEPLLSERSLEELGIARDAIGVNEHLVLFLSNDKSHRFAFAEVHDVRLRRCVGHCGRLCCIVHLGEIAEAAARQSRLDVAGEDRSEVPK